MKVKDVIAFVDKAYTNQINPEVKISLLADLDRKIEADIYATHEGDYPRAAKTYTENTELIVPEPHSRMYNYYLQAQLSLILNQGNRYSSYAALYDSAYSEFAKKYNREHAPIHRVGALKLT